MWGSREVILRIVRLQAATAARRYRFHPERVAGVLAGAVTWLELLHETTAEVTITKPRINSAMLRIGRLLLLRPLLYHSLSRMALP
jgi:hypothetical protein